MKFSVALSIAAVVGGVVARPALHPRQSGCPAPTEASCVELHDRCVSQGSSVLNDPWNNRVCTAAATCYGVGNLLTSYACRLGVNPPTPSSLPSLSTSFFPNPTTQQNYIDFYYGTINSAWPSSVNVVTGYWAPIISWINTGSSAPYNNLNDWFHWSSTPTTVTSGPTGTTSTPTSTTTPTTPPTPTAAIPGVFVETCTNGVSISYDDGPYVWNSDIVGLYDAGGAKTTFFVNGNNWDCIYNQARVNDLRNAYESGHTIGSHTWFHTDITTITNQQLGDELDRLEEALWKILGIKPALFRPPYGAMDQEKLAYLNSRGYTVVRWDVDTRDADGASVAESKLAIQAEATDHSMILSHETYQSSADQLAPWAIDYLKNQRGFTLNSVDQCLNIPAYHAVGSYGTRDSTWTC